MDKTQRPLLDTRPVLEAVSPIFWGISFILFFWPKANRRKLWASATGSFSPTTLPYSFMGKGRKYRNQIVPR